MKKLIVIAVFALFSASSAISASLTPSIGLSGNMAGFAAHGVERNFDESGVVRTSNEEHGAFADSYASIFLELGIGEVVSIGLDYVPMSISTPTNFSREGTGSPQSTSQHNPGSSSVSADFEDLTTAYVKLNVLPLGGTYLKLGFSQVDVVVNDKMASGNTYKDVNTEGYMVGLGYNHALSNGLSIRAEVAANQYDDVQTDNGVTTASESNGGENKVIIESMWSARGTVSLVKSF